MKNSMLSRTHLALPTCQRPIALKAVLAAILFLALAPAQAQVGTLTDDATAGSPR
jgi:hypothetical protein